MKTALVVGGAGFIGSHLLAALRASGEYDRLVSADLAEPRFAVDGVDYRHFDIREPLPVDFCPDVAEIYNLAAVHVTPGHEDREYFWTNVLAATHVCAFARQTGCRKLVFASSISVYGPSEEPKSEAAAPEPESAYGMSKLAAEKIHQDWAAEHEDRKLVIVRPAVVYGRGERGNFTRLARLLRKRRFVYPGRKDTIKSCGYVEDLVSSFSFMLARPERSITYNFAHVARPTLEDIAQALSKVGGYAAPRVVVPTGPMLLAAWGFEVLSAVGLRTSINRERILKLTRSTNIVPQVLQDMGFVYRFTLEQSLQNWKTTSGGNFI